MVASRSTLSRDTIVERLTTLLDPGDVITDEAALLEASVDRFKKYSAMHGIFDGPIPAAILRPRSTQQVAAVLRLPKSTSSMSCPAPGGPPPKVVWKPWSRTPSCSTGPR